MDSTFVIRLTGGCWLRVSLTLLLAASALWAQSPLASRVLVVYVANDSNSAAVANYYQAQRGIPAANMCPVTLPNPNVFNFSQPDYSNYFKAPVQSCLNAVGARKILYIVLAYVRPSAVDPTGAVREYSMDSYLADIWDQYTSQTLYPYPVKTHSYYVENQSKGDVYTPYQPFAQYRDSASLPLIYSVWRLDGVTPALAEALVSNAMAAEAAGGPISQQPGSPSSACIDMVIDPSGFADSAYRAADWDLLRASQFLSAANNFNLITDTNSASFGTPPAPLCPNTGIYAGWYNYGTYNDAFSWSPGSIGWDLDSGAMVDPRSPSIWWGTNALQRGLTVSSGPMAEPYLEGLPRPGGVIRNLLEGANVGDAFLRNTRWLKWMILNVGDPLYTPFASKLAPFNAPVAANSLSLRPREATGTSPVAVVLTLSSPAPAPGLTVNLATSDSSFIVPASLYVPPGASSASFLAQTANVATSFDIWVTASTATMSVTNTFTIDPLLYGVEFDSDSVRGGSTVSATIYLNASAPVGGATVRLTSDQPNVAPVPASVLVPEGLSAVNFTVSTAAVSSNTNVNITASYAGATPAATLTVTP